jgi:putative transposase
VGCGRASDAHREACGVEPICAVLPIAPSRYYELTARARDPRASAGADAVRRGTVRGHWPRVAGEPEVYGARKVWKPLQRDGYAVARGTVARLMRQLGLAGVVRGPDVQGDDDPGPRGRRIWSRASSRRRDRTSGGSRT